MTASKRSVVSWLDLRYRRPVPSMNVVAGLIAGATSGSSLKARSAWMLVVESPSMEAVYVWHARPSGGHPATASITSSTNAREPS